MRMLLLCWIALTFAFAGCCSNESAPPVEAEVKSAVEECPDCCSTISRAAILKKSSDAQPSDEKAQ